MPTDGLDRNVLTSDHERATPNERSTDRYRAIKWMTGVPVEVVVIKFKQQCDAGSLLSRREWKQMDASELTGRGGISVAFGWNLMNFIPDGRLCQQNSFGKNPRRNPR